MQLLMLLYFLREFISHPVYLIVCNLHLLISGQTGVLKKIVFINAEKD